MLANIDLNKKLDKEEYRQELNNLQKKLASLQQKIKELKIPVIIYFEGWSAAGKGTLMSKMLSPLDPRQYNVHTLRRVTEEMKMRPFLWYYWTKIPSKGRITIFDKGWIRAALPEYISSWNLNHNEKENFYYDVNAFEKQLSDDGTVIIKFFLHISKDEQKKRFKALEKKSDTKWRVNEMDWQQNKDYEKCTGIFEKMINNTNSNESPWNIIEANDRRFATIKIFKIFIKRIEEEIQRKIEKNNIIFPEPDIDHSNVSILSSCDLTQEISTEEYKDKLKYFQEKLSYLGYKLYAKRKPVVIVYEGWDAAGKGGNIKRITDKLDPRGYEVVPIASPTQEELEHHYLWRFYKKLPKDGHIAIFDRSWYGRVLVERIEGFCTNEEWQRAYKEINDMELHWSNHGIKILKFWVNIDKDEQLRRFEARQNDPLKQYKITAEDWRNREKWDLYEKAVNDMLFRTSTEYAPWTVVESNDKKFARIKTLEILTKELEHI